MLYVKINLAIIHDLTFYLIYFSKNPIFTGSMCGWQSKKVKTLQYPQKSSSSQASKSHIGKAETITQDPEWNNAAYVEKKEKSYRFAQPAYGSTNTHFHLYHREGMETWEKKFGPHRKQSKKNRKEVKSKIKLS